MSWWFEYIYIVNLLTPVVQISQNFPEFPEFHSEKKNGVDLCSVVSGGA